MLLYVTIGSVDDRFDRFNRLSPLRFMDSRSLVAGRINVTGRMF